MKNESIDEKLYGDDFFGLGVNGKPAAAPLAEKFVIPPFSVLNAREGIWQDRKRAWLSLGIQSEVGRGNTEVNTPHTGKACAAGLIELRNEQKAAKHCGSKLTMSPQIQALKPSADQTLKNDLARRGHAIPGGGTGKNSAYMFKDANGYASLKERGEGTAAGLTFGAFSDEFSLPASGTSIFDPVLCELAYRWFSGEMGQIIDPFAGGSVRGVVASLLGRAYWGCELRPEQVEANLEQGRLICPDNPPKWVCGDSLVEMKNAPEADGILACPPYFDLEVYSDLPEDLSAMTWPQFLEAYREIIKVTCSRLRDNRFAVFVVGDMRDKQGNYRNFNGETVRAFEECGLKLYNEAVLVTSVGSLPVRITKQFDSGRKLGRTHQSVLVFCKGNWKQAANYCNEIP